MTKDLSLHDPKKSDRDYNIHSKKQLYLSLAGYKTSVHSNDEDVWPVVAFDNTAIDRDPKS